jgi:HSP20 family molecular chaperone IbpA
MLSNWFLDFDKDFYRFSRGVKDNFPYQIKRAKDHATIIHNVVGINPKDIHVEIEPERNVTYLVVRGETKNEVTDSTYSVNSRFTINDDEIKEIKYETKDGLLYVDIYYKEPEKVNIKISER